MQKRVVALMAVLVLAAGCRTAAPQPSGVQTPPAPIEMPPHPAEEKPPVVPPSNPDGVTAARWITAQIKTDGVPGAGPAVPVTADMGYMAVGSALMRTVDGGRTWERHAQLPGTITVLDFVSPDEGWAQTPEGWLATLDGGRTWQPVERPGGRLSWAVKGGCGDRFDTSLGSFISPKVGWVMCLGQPAVGTQDKQLIKTSDGGETWVTVAAGVRGAPELPQTLSVGGYGGTPFFLDEQHGWLTSRHGLSATADGGRSWRGVKVVPYWEPRISGTRFATPQVGWIRTSYGSTPALLGTRDGGATWEQLYPKIYPVGHRTTYDASTFVRLNEQTGFAAGSLLDPGAILRTEDGGVTWTQISALADKRVKAISFANPEHGWALVEAGEPGKPGTSLYQTDDGGRSWSRIAAAETLGLSQIQRLSPAIGYVSSGVNGLYVTRDAGRTFEVVESDRPVRAAVFTSPEQGWSIGDGVLYGSEDGGRSWAPIPLGYYRVVEFSLLPGGYAWVIVNDCEGGECSPALLSTADNARSWTRYDLGEITPDGVTFGTPTHGWLIDQHGYRYSTEDGGQTWQRQQ